MRNFQRQKVWKSFVESRPVLVLLGIIILLFAWNIWGLWGRMQETERNKKSAEDKISSLELQKQDLSTEINNLQTEQGKEKVFRENFGLAKTGENEIVILDDKNPAPAPAPSQSSGFMSFLKGLFK